MQDFQRSPASEYVLPTQAMLPRLKKTSKYASFKETLTTVQKDRDARFTKSSKKELNIVKEKTDRKTLQKNIILLNKKIKTYEEKNVELKKKNKESQSELHKAQDNMKKVCNTLHELQKTSLKLSSVNSLVFKALRFGCGLGILVESASIITKMNFLLEAWKRLMVNAFGNKTLRQNEFKNQLSPFTSNHITLLRTEQLLLLQQNSYLLNQVEILQKALKQSPQKAAKIFFEFSKSVGTLKKEISSEGTPVSFSNNLTKIPQHSCNTMRLFVSHFTYTVECQIQKQTFMTLNILRRACKLSPSMYAGALMFVCSIRYLIKEILQENFYTFQKEMQHTRRYGIQDLHNCLLQKEKAYTTGNCLCNVCSRCELTENQLTRQSPNKTSQCKAFLCTNLATMENALVTPDYYYRFPSVVEWMKNAAYRY